MCETAAATAAAAAVEVVGFRDGTLLRCRSATRPASGPATVIVRARRASRSAVGPALLGRVIDGTRPAARRPRAARTTDDGCRSIRRRSIRWRASRSSRRCGTGVRAIDALLTCGRGQRVGLFGGSGVGKSTLLGMMARGTAADVVVIALVGERGREVRGFLEHDLGPRRAARDRWSSSRPPTIRRWCGMRAAYAATAIAEYFRDQGKNVLLMMDSVTRFAMAQREVGLAAGEPPTAKGYPPSVFALLPALLERAGDVRGPRQHHGDLHRARRRRRHNEPIADAVRSILDGHIVLSRDLAARNHYPRDRHPAERQPDDAGRDRRRSIAARAGQVREWMAAIRDSEDLVSVGAYVAGQQPADRRSARPARRDSTASSVSPPTWQCGFTDAVAALEAL